MSMDPTQERYAAPYGFVPFPTRCERQTAVAQSTETGWRGVVSGGFITVFPLRVGTGLYELGSGGAITLHQPLFRANGVPTVPGATIKGALRAVVEAMTRSCVGAGRGHRGFDRCTAKHEDGKVPELCPACRLFGTQDFGGRVRCGDAVAPDAKIRMVKLPALWRPRPETPNLYFQADGRTPKGRKFYKHAYSEAGTMPAEVCEAGSRFSCDISFEGLTGPEVGVLLVALGHPPPGETHGLVLKLGSHKPSGYGSVRFETASLTATQGARRWEETDWNTSADAHTASAGQVAEFIEGCRNADWFWSDGHAELRRILCPKRSELRLGGYEVKQWSQRHPRR